MNVVPRRNSSVIEKKQRAFHGATRYHSNYRRKCVGCFFVGDNFTCTTSDGKCLKTPIRKQKRNFSKHHGDRRKAKQHQTNHHQALDGDDYL